MSIAFDDGAAASLGATVDAAAKELRDQATLRRTSIETAMDQFSGGYATVFTQACVVEAEDRAKLAGKLESLSYQIDQAQLKATEERQRLADLAAWQAREDKRDLDRLLNPVPAGRGPLLQEPDDPQPETFPVAPPTISAAFFARPRTRTSSGAGVSQKTSADPLTLRGFATVSQSANGRIEQHLHATQQAWANFVNLCSWVNVESTSFVPGFSGLLAENKLDVSWMQMVAGAFERAGGGSLTGRELNFATIFLARGRDAGAARPLVAVAADEAAAEFGQTPEEFNAMLDGLSDEEFVAHMSVDRFDRERYWYELSILSAKNLKRLEAAEPTLFEPGTDQFPTGDGFSVEVRKFAGILTSRGKVTWKTPPGELGLPEDWKNIKQGQTGDCWFVAALAMQLRKDTDGEWFSNHVKVNPNGTITVLLRDVKTGKFTPVTVTDRLPSFEKGTVHLTGLNLASYIEKAAAEFYQHDSDGYSPGLYATIESDASENAFNMFADANLESIPSDGNAGKVWDEVRKGTPVAVSTLPAKPEVIDSVDLGGKYWEGHVYISGGLTEDGRIVLMNPHDLSDRRKYIYLTPVQFEEWTRRALVVL